MHEFSYRTTHLTLQYKVDLALHAIRVVVWKAGMQPRRTLMRLAFRIRAFQGRPTLPTYLLEDSQGASPTVGHINCSPGRRMATSIHHPESQYFVLLASIPSSAQDSLGFGSSSSHAFLLEDQQD